MAMALYAESRAYQVSQARRFVACLVIQTVLFLKPSGYFRGCRVGYESMLSGGPLLWLETVLFALRQS